MSDVTTIVPTTEQLRALSHPVRVRLLGLLRMDGPQTSADLARATGLNTGATSYHLRQLAQHGFIEDAPGGSGRERFWRARHRNTNPTGPDDSPANPGSSASVDDLAAWQQTVLTWTTGVLQGAQDEWTELPEEWRHVSRMNDYLLRLTAEQAHQVQQRLHALLADVVDAYGFDPDQAGSSGADPHAADPHAADPHAADGTELWVVHLLTHPVPGRIPHREEDR